MRIAKTLTMAAMVVALAGPAWAQGTTGQTGGAQPGTSGTKQGQMKRGRGMDAGRAHAKQMMARLNLTDAQKKQVDELMNDARTRQQGLMQQLQKLHEQLRDQVFADQGPGGDTAALAKQINDLQAQMLESQISLHEQISKVLDPEQRKKMREMPMPGMMGGGMPMRRSR